MISKIIITLNLLLVSAMPAYRTLFFYKILPSNYLALHTDFKLDYDELCPPIVKDNILYQGLHNNLILAQHIRKKRVLWQFKTNGSPTSTIIYKDLLITTTLKGYIYALNNNTGKTVWSYNTHKQILSSPVINGETAYLQTTLDTLYAFNVSDGSLLWQYSAKNIFSGLIVHATPAPYIYRDILFTGFSNGSAVAINAGTGKLIWEKKPLTIKQLQDIVTTPAGNDQIVIMGSYDKGLMCLNKQDGTLVWERNDLTRPLGLYITGNAVYITRSNGDLYRLDMRTGDTIWKESLGDETRLLGPVQENNFLVIGVASGTYKGVVLINPDDGQIMHHFSIVSGLSAQPVVVNDIIYATSNGGFLYSYGPSSVKSLNGFPYIGIFHR
jgi:outer membrane protein assembly factor BamB